MDTGIHWNYKSLILFFIYNYITSAYCGQICHLCEDIPRPEECPYVKECGPHETCATESYTSPSGHILYKMSCKDTSQCNGFTLNSVYTPICSGCCSGDLCGVSLCGNSGYSQPRGPVCFNCIYQMDQPSHCGKVKVCSRDESCGVLKLENGLYEVKCLSNQTCQAPGPDVTCGSCCNSDVCNRNCRLPSECKDNELCPVLLSTYPDLCTQPKLSIQCNGTCLKQKNQTCNGIPGSSTTYPTTSSTIKPITSPTTASTTTKSTTISTTTSTTMSTTSSTTKPSTTPSATVSGCADEPSCPFIQKTNVNFCSDATLMIYCNQTCGICALMASSGGSTNPCLFHPCVNGQCHPHASSSSVSYTCDCHLGFIGARCDHRDPCYSQPCVHGQCTVKDSVGGYQCHCDLGFSGPICDVGLVRDCQDVLDNNVPSTGDGIYVLDINENVLGSRKLNVKCEFKNNQGWTVLMNRYTGQLDFDHKFSSEYAVGFGNVRDEFWMGLEYMHALTSDGRQYQLRIDMTMANGSHYYEIYNGFSVGPHNKFELNLGGTHFGTAGDSLSGHATFGFTTKDRDQDSNSGKNCANYISGGWWFHDCADSCLTCNYITPGTYDCKSMSWQKLGYCIGLKSVSMKIRPL